MPNRSSSTIHSFLYSLGRIFILSWRSFGALRWNLASWVRSWLMFLRSYKIQSQNSSFHRSIKLWYPVLHESSYYGKIDPVYMFQNAWCAGKILNDSPARHVDIASSLHLISVIGQCLPVEFIDMHDPGLVFSGVSYRSGDITKLPFQDGSVVSLSSLCVIEHIGLGRYGDTLDAFGSERAARESVRVLATAGKLYISLPVDSENRIYHNAHRAFTRDYVVNNLFKELTLVEEKYIYKDHLGDRYDSAKGFGTGLFEFTKL